MTPDHDKLIEAIDEEKSLEEKVSELQKRVNETVKNIERLNKLYITFAAIWSVVALCFIYITYNHINIVKLIRFLRI